MLLYSFPTDMTLVICDFNIFSWSRQMGREMAMSVLFNSKEWFQVGTVSYFSMFKSYWAGEYFLGRNYIFQALYSGLKFIRYKLYCRNPHKTIKKIPNTYLLNRRFPREFSAKEHIFSYLLLRYTASPSLARGFR